MSVLIVYLAVLLAMEKFGLGIPQSIEEQQMSEEPASKPYVRYSVRERERARQGEPVEFMYDEFPDRLRAHFVQTLDRTIGKIKRSGTSYVGMPEEYSPSRVWGDIVEVIEHVLEIPRIGSGNFARDRFATHMVDKRLSSDDVFDTIEVSLIALKAFMPSLTDQGMRRYDCWYSVDGAIVHLNQRFLEHDLGFQFIDGYIVRMDSQYLHVEATEPAVRLLQRKGFERAEKEFMEAHKHYRRSEYADAMLDANRAFESTMKIALERRGVVLAGTERANELTEKITKQLLPPRLQPAMKSLPTVLQSVPNLRNSSEVGHGGGSAEEQTLDALAAYSLEATAAAIKLIVERLTEADA